MYYSNLLKIANTSTDTFWGILAIATLILIVYAFVYSRFIASKTELNAKKAKRIAIEQMNMRCALAGINPEDEEEPDEEDNDEYDEDEEEYE